MKKKNKDIFGILYFIMKIKNLTGKNLFNF